MIKKLDQSKLTECLDILHKGYEPTAIQFKLTNDNCPYRGRADLPLAVLVEEFLSGIEIYGYYEADNIVALISIYTEKNTIKINDIVVLPEFWNKGIGTALLEFIKEKAAKQNISKIMLGMIDDNTVLKKWYEKNGFINIGYKKFPNAPFTVGYMEWNLK